MENIIASNDYISIEELRERINHAESIKKPIENLEVYEKETLKEAFGKKLKRLFVKTSKATFFATSMPFYWFIVFKNVVGWFDIGFFMFVVAVSFALSLTKNNWGIINSAIA